MCNDYIHNLKFELDQNSGGEKTIRLCVILFCYVIVLANEIIYHGNNLYKIVKTIVKHIENIICQTWVIHMYIHVYVEQQFSMNILKDNADKIIDVFK